MTRVLLGGIEMRPRTSLVGLRVFLASLRAHEPDLSIVFFNRSLDHHELSSLLSTFQVESLPAGYPDVEIEIARFLCYREWLEHETVSQVIMTDVLDVLWQGPIPRPRNGLSLYQEHTTVGMCPYNSKWLQQTFPFDWEDLAALPVVCCGVLHGTHDSVLQYLDWYTQIFTFQRSRVRRGFDSAVVNRYGGHRYLFPYLNTECVHLGYADRASVSLSDTGQVSVDGWIPDIVHQYNRHPLVTKGLVERWT